MNRENKNPTKEYTISVPYEAKAEVRMVKIMLYDRDDELIRSLNIEVSWNETTN